MCKIGALTISVYIILGSLFSELNLCRKEKVFIVYYFGENDQVIHLYKCGSYNIIVMLMHKRDDKAHICLMGQSQISCDASAMGKTREI